MDGMTLDEAIMKLDLIASDAFEGGDANEFRQLAEWLRELKAYKANREGYCSWCSNLKDRHLRIEYYWIDDEGNTASYVGKTNQVATGIARFCPCCGRFIEMEVNADEEGSDSE